MKPAAILCAGVFLLWAIHEEEGTRNTILTLVAAAALSFLILKYGVSLL